MKVRYNNLTESRLLFAVAVLVAHTFQLSGASRSALSHLIFSSERAVQAFFILSGFLILGSYERSPNLKDFYLRRGLRIYPAYVVAVLFFLGLILSQALAVGAPVNFSEVPRYLAANLSLMNFLQDTIGGVFTANPYPHLNGALWTIKIEVMFYLLVPLIFWAGRRFSFLWTGLVVIGAGLLWRPLLAELAARGLPLHPSLEHQLPGQLQFFGLGVLFFHYCRTPGAAWPAVAGVLGCVAIASLTGQLDTGMNMLVLSALIVALVFSPQIPSPLGHHDLSYGVYLCHFPLIQIFVAQADWSTRPYLLLPLVLAAAGVYAWLSWTYIEHPLLDWKKRHEARH